jgi:hypothetical protein
MRRGSGGGLCRNAETRLINLPGGESFPSHLGRGTFFEDRRFLSKSKRDKSTGQFMDQKAHRVKFKGVRKE